GRRRTAAPTFLMRTNNLHDASSTAPTLVAESRKYNVFAATRPRLPRNPAFEPRVSASETMHRTPGPGVKHSTVSVAQKSSHAWNDIDQFVPSSSARSLFGATDRHDCASSVRSSSWRTTESPINIIG